MCQTRTIKKELSNIDDVYIIKRGSENLTTNTIHFIICIIIEGDKNPLNILESGNKEDT